MAKRWYSNDDNAAELERSNLVRLKNLLEDDLPGYDVHFVSKNLFGMPEIMIGYPELLQLMPEMNLIIRFRYEKSVGYSVRGGLVCGISCAFKADPTNRYSSARRNYGYDFDHERVKKAAYQKLVAFIKSETEVKLFRVKNNIDRNTAKKALLKQSAEKLKTAGYAVETNKSNMLLSKEDKRVRFSVSRPNGGFVQSFEVLANGRIGHELGEVDLKDLPNFTGCLEQALRYTK